MITMQFHGMSTKAIAVADQQSRALRSFFSLTRSRSTAIATGLPYRYSRGKSVQPLLRSQYCTRPCSTTTNPNAILCLPPLYLRQMDKSNFDPGTHQRVDALFDVNSGKPLREKKSSAHNTKLCLDIEKSEIHGDEYVVSWRDGHVSRYSIQWVKDTLFDSTSPPTTRTNRILWSDLTEEKIRSSESTTTVPFDELLEEDGTRRALQSLYTYGILLVTNTPVENSKTGGVGGAGVAALASCLGGGSIKNETTVLGNYKAGHRDETILPNGTDGPLRTLYGTVWSTNSAAQAEGASVADSAYGCEGLPLHTDMTYHRDPPGLQIFTMVHPAERGGESVFGDGFAVAEHIRRTDPDAFATLSNTVRRYRCVDESMGWHLEASGRMIETSPLNGEIVSIRHNDLDRLPDLPSHDCGNFEKYYEDLERAHGVWDGVLAQDSMRLVVSLRRGDTMVVANQRCFHGRYSFHANPASPRSVMGCYVSQDELNSRFRLLGNPVH